MANLVIVQNESSKYSENLFPYKSTLNDTLTPTVTGGVATVSLKSDVPRYNRKRSIEVIYNDTNNSIFNLGDGLSFVAQSDGVYKISLRLFVPTTYSANLFGFTATFFVNGVGSAKDFTSSAEGFEFGKWNTFVQLVSMTSGQVFDMTIRTLSDAVATKSYLGGFKAELDDRNANIISKYTEPTNILDTSVTLAFGTVSGNFYNDLNVSLPGAVLGDVIFIGTPILTDDYHFTAFVSSTNNVTVRCLNLTSGSVVVASGNFKIKIFK